MKKLGLILFILLWSSLVDARRTDILTLRAYVPLVVSINQFDTNAGKKGEIHLNSKSKLITMKEVSRRPNHDGREKNQQSLKKYVVIAHN